MRILILSLLVLLGACASQKPVPVDNYYRLPDIDAASVPDVALSDGMIFVDILETDGLHRERALVYSESREGLELNQYHYQHWIDSPTRMIRDHLVQYLRAAAAAPTIVTSVDLYPQIEITGKINRFDQIINDGKTEVVIALELRADKEGRLIHIQDYHLSEAVNGDSFEDIVSAYNKVLITCFTQFINNVKATL